MEIVICSSTQQVGDVAAARVAQVCRAAGPNAVLGVATGSSPLSCYTGLAERVRSGSLDLSRASAFALDEYVGLPRGHEESYAEVIRRTVTEPLGLDPARVHTPDGFADDLEAACADYERRIAGAGGVDVQILGVGANGHIGFNEPSSSLSSRTRIKTLTDRTREDNRRFFAELDDVPRHCLTQGLGTIMDARAVVLIAQGGGKARAIRNLVEGPITAMCPGSVLQFHRYATVVIDDAAAAELQHADYYRETYAHKPSWQRFEN
ncbi:glucosamine-6-phosphate deaminase [Nigerium massiliense]|uniref:glucosamine-6-phosphate deaminase n=1 Tax=Nigerium massiliense TaxID=1522317 RepID=UPI00058E7A69|nr:glucosamine-6-phosphate deaminase [Nigerium massiliense]